MIDDDFDDEEDTRDGWDDDRDDDRDRGCVLGKECLVADPFHGSDECFDAEMAQNFFGGDADPSAARFEYRELAEPCGWPKPIVDRGLHPVGITWEPLGVEARTTDELRAVCAMLLRACDECDYANGERR